MVKALVCGAAGRMGRLIIQTILQTEGIEITGAVEAKGNTSVGEDVGIIVGEGGELGIKISDSLEKIVDKAEVVIDFTTPQATREAVSIAYKHHKSMVIGTTGLEDEVIEQIRRLAKLVPVVVSPNMSIGINLLFSLLPQVAKTLGKDYDIEIIEAHHRFKKDAPSGTAIRLAQILADAKGLDINKVGVYGRKGLTGERQKHEIGIHAIRAGDITGEHTVIFCGIGERIEITHKAHSRDNFARGAVKAAIWIVDQPPGLYDMQDVLGLK